MSTQTASYANGVITLTKRDGTVQLLPFNVENEAAAAWADWTPVYSSGLGNAAATFSAAGVTTRIARWKRVGKIVDVAVWLAAVALAGQTPDEIWVTLPVAAGLPYSPDAANNIYARTPASIVNAATAETGIVRAVVVAGIAYLKFVRANSVAWGNGAVIECRVSGMTFEVI